MIMRRESWTSDAQEKNDHGFLAYGIPESQEQYQGVDPDNHRSAPTEMSSHKDAYEWQELLACPCVRPSE